MGDLAQDDVNPNIMRVLLGILSLGAALIIRQQGFQKRREGFKAVGLSKEL